jgi:hypothetical protein
MTAEAAEKAVKRFMDEMVVQECRSAAGSICGDEKDTAMGCTAGSGDEKNLRVGERWRTGT